MLSEDSRLKLFRSPNRTVRVRAAKLLLARPEGVSLDVVLEMLDDLYNQGLGAGVERVLLNSSRPGSRRCDYRQNKIS